MAIQELWPPSSAALLKMPGAHLVSIAKPRVALTRTGNSESWLIREARIGI
jgi:hypothetical protein